VCRVLCCATEYDRLIKMAIVTSSVAKVMLLKILKSVKSSKS